MTLVLKYGVIAQLGERLHGMQEVIGSIPISSTISRSLSGGIAQLGEHLLCKQRVIGSIPFTSTIKKQSNTNLLLNITIYKLRIVTCIAIILWLYN